MSVGFHIYMNINILHTKHKATKRKQKYIKSFKVIIIEIYCKLLTSTQFFFGWVIVPLLPPPPLIYTPPHPCILKPESLTPFLQEKYYNSRELKANVCLSNWLTSPETTWWWWLAPHRAPRSAHDLARARDVAASTTATATAWRRPAPTAWSSHRYLLLGRVHTVKLPHPPTTQ